MGLNDEALSRSHPYFSPQSCVFTLGTGQIEFGTRKTTPSPTRKKAITLRVTALPNRGTQVASPRPKLTIIAPEARKSACEKTNGETTVPDR